MIPFDRVAGAALLVLAAAYYLTNISRVLLFWAAFILTRPLEHEGGVFEAEVVRVGHPVAERRAQRPGWALSAIARACSMVIFAFAG